MARYPKPAGWKGGPDGSIQRQGSGGRLGGSSNDEHDHGPAENRMNILDFDEANFANGGMCDYDGDEY